jgi:hypothetical protein
MVLQVLQRIVDAMVLAPHVSEVNGRSNIPLGNSDARRAMYDTLNGQNFVCSVACNMATVTQNKHTPHSKCNFHWFVRLC